MVNEKSELERILKETLDYLDEENELCCNNLDSQQIKYVHNLTDNAESQKAVLTVVITSLTKKILNPSQDIRKHQSKFDGGYSGRSLDTNVVTPFMKEYFHRFSMAESGWLTRSLEQPYPYDLNYGGEIRNISVKKSFLEILNDVEENGIDPEVYLKCILSELIKKLESVQKTLDDIEIDKELPIQKIISLLEKHFNTRGASRLPVIAIYSVLDLLIDDLERYEGKELAPLKSHTTSDATSKSIGDVEILDCEHNYYEAIEIKHKKKIDHILVKDVYEKFKKIGIKRYLILTTADPEIEPMLKGKVLKVIEKIYEDHGCQVITNGVVPTIKYYLRLLKKPSDFIRNYTRYLKEEYKENTDIKDLHIDTWREILEEAGIRLN